MCSYSPPAPAVVNVQLQSAPAVVNPSTSNAAALPPQASQSNDVAQAKRDEPQPPIETVVEAQTAEGLIINQDEQEQEQEQEQEAQAIKEIIGATLAQVVF